MIESSSVHESLPSYLFTSPIPLEPPIVNNKSESDQMGGQRGLKPEIEVLIYILYGSLVVAAVTSNTIVCYIVLSSQRMRTATNYFIVNLAVGDILMALLCIPFSVLSNFIFQYWPFGTAMCIIVSHAQVNSVFVSSYTMVAISIDRYLAIMYPMRLRMTKQQSKIIIAIIWSAAILTSLPTAITSNVEPMKENKDRYRCIENWRENNQKISYTIALMLLQFVFPLFVLVITYTRIAIVIWVKRTPGEAENARDAKIARSKRKVSKLQREPPLKAE